MDGHGLGNLFIQKFSTLRLSNFSSSSDRHVRSARNKADCLTPREREKLVASLGVNVSVHLVVGS